MATLVLSSVGTLIGGPLGGSIGAMVGQRIDSDLFGQRREGPRLKELAITTSSYGSPLPRHFGRMRVAGSIIWATELQETREKSGGKGKPKITEYSYSSSFAVALASRPIAGIGRIWADGNLLRGAAGDLKVGGSMRIHHGYGDQAADPLIASDRGQQGCPAFRGVAYVVFEDLQLGDFGNRIPALTFELIADYNAPDAAMLVEDVGEEIVTDMRFPELTGFSYEGGPIAETLDMIGTIYAFTIRAGGETLTLLDESSSAAAPMALPPPAIAWDDNDFGQDDGQQRERGNSHNRVPCVLRYYDVARDYQPGVQRVGGRINIGAEIAIQFPGALNADAARGLLDKAAARARFSGDRLRWRTTELDPRIVPGVTVTIPDEGGVLWIVEEWEWREKGVELGLRRLPTNRAPEYNGDSGLALLPPDDIVGPTILRAIELPWDGQGTSDARHIYVAAGSSSSIWRGATIYADRATGLEPLARTSRVPAAIGTLVEPLAPARSVLFDPDAKLSVTLDTAHPGFRSETLEALAEGANRLWIGSEILQFAQAQQHTQSLWTLTGLLRGRGGTEHIARTGHDAGTACILIDEALLELDASGITPGAPVTFAAIGFGDEEPVSVTLDSEGGSLDVQSPALQYLTPLSPAHARIDRLPDGNVRICWLRRARGAWQWLDHGDVPLHEDSERYAIGIGDPATSPTIWETAEPKLTIPAADLSTGPIWIRQIGRFGPSPALSVYL